MKTVENYKDKNVEIMRLCKNESFSVNTANNLYYEVYFLIENHIIFYINPDIFYMDI